MFERPLSLTQVRGDVTVRWCRHLAGAYCDRIRGVRVDDGALQAYVGIDGVPESLAAAAIASSEEEEAADLARVSRRALCVRLFVGAVREDDSSTHAACIEQLRARGSAQCTP